MNKILNALNLKIDNNQMWILLSLLFSGFLLTYISPTIVKEIYSKLPVEWIAFESLFGSISGLVISMLWRGAIRRIAIKQFIILIIFETLCGLCMCIYLVFIEYNVWILAITSLIYTSFVTIFVDKCIMAFKTKLWNNKEREFYDNNIQIILGFVSIIGYTFALLFSPTLNTALILWGIAYLTDDLGWAIVYIKNKKTLINIEK